MRLIDADALMEDIRKHSASYFADDFAREWVDKQPTIEPERKKGKWIQHYIGQDHIPWGSNCSVCGEWMMIDHLVMNRKYHFCPNCGADCRGEEDV